MLRLVKTCSACPEQYDAFDGDRCRIGKMGAQQREGKPCDACAAQPAQEMDGRACGDAARACPQCVEPVLDDVNIVCKGLVPASCDMMAKKAGDAVYCCAPALLCPDKA